MNVLSLFDGISCGQVAFQRAGIEVDKYYAAEIDKYAIQVTQSNWPNTIQLGSVENWREWDINWSSIDYLIGGSPCQGFSFAGKQLAFDDPRSKLFFVYVDILNHIKALNPSVKFLLENVKMKKEYLDVISEHLGVEPVFINSALVSAQNRQRHYWCNWEVSQPEDKRIMLTDILESGIVDESNKLDRKIARLETGHCAEAVINSASMVGRKINPSTGKRDDYSSEIKTTQCLEVNANGKSRCLTTVSKDSLISDLPAGRYIDYERKNYRPFTPVECERLQTLPDNYTTELSKTQRIKALGNGWTVDVIKHILECSK